MRLVLGALLAAILTFAWGFVSWVVLPFHVQSLRTLPDEPALRAALDDIDAGMGTYAYPARAGLSEAEWAARMKSGPAGLVVHFPAGQDTQDPVVFARGFALQFVFALVAGLLLCVASVRLPTYWHRVLFVTSFGGIAALVHLTSWNWGMATLDQAVLLAMDELIAWLLAGLALAACVRCKVPRASTAVP